MAIEWDADLYAHNTAHHRAYDDHLLAPLHMAPNRLPASSTSAAVPATSPPAAAAFVLDGAVLDVDPLGTARRPCQQRPSPQDQPRALGMPTPRRTSPRSDRPHCRMARASGRRLTWWSRRRRCTGYTNATSSAPTAACATCCEPAGLRARVRRHRTDQVTTVSVLDEESARLGGPATPWYFPPAEAVAEALVAVGFSLDAGFVRLVTQRRAVPDAAALRGWLESQVLIAYRPGPAASTDVCDLACAPIERLVTRGTACRRHLRPALRAARPAREQAARESLLGATTRCA